MGRDVVQRPLARRAWRVMWMTEFPVGVYRGSTMPIGGVGC